MIRRSGFKRSIAFTLVLTMLLATVSFGAGFSGVMPGSEVHAADVPTSVNVSVRIEATTGTALNHTELSVEKFDITPFMTGGVTGFSSPAEIKSAHALIEAVYYSIYGVDPSGTDLAVSADSTTASAIKGVLKISNGSLELGIQEMFGDTALVMSTINDAGGRGIGSDAISQGDNIVFYPWSLNYAYFDILKITPMIEDTGGSGIYPYLEIKVGLNESGYDESNNTVISPVTSAAITDDSFFPGYEPITDSSGVATANLYGGTASGIYNFELSATKDGGTFVIPYCSIAFTYDADSTTITAVEISQPIVDKDTSLGTLSLEFTGVGGETNGQNILGDTGITVGNEVTSVSISAIAAAETTDGEKVTVTAVYKPAGGIYGDILTYDEYGTKLNFILLQGQNVFKITVSNGYVEETYTLIVTRSGDSEDTTESDVASVIAGIRDITDSHASSYYSSDWVLGMAAGNMPLTDAEKEKYLINVMADVLKSGTSTASKAKMAIALTAMNIDARQVANKDGGQAIDLIKEVAYSTGDIHPAYSAPLILSMYDLGNYEIPADAVITRESLIASILDNQDTDGSWYGSFGADGTGMVLPALAPYYNAASEVNGISVASCEAITLSINRAISYLSSKQGIDGSFPGYNGEPNSNTMIADIIGLNALGINSNANSSFIKSGRSAMENLLTYKTSDNKLGFKDNLTADEYTCQQGLGALATHQNLNNDRSSNLYHFTKEIAPYTNWPSDVDLLTGIKATAPTVTEYEYNASSTSKVIDVTGVVVTATYNGDATNTKNIPLDECIVSTINPSIVGTQTVIVTYQGQTTSFMVTITNSDGTVPAQDLVSVKVVNNNTTIASNNSVVIQAGKTTALDVLKTVLDGANKSYVIVGNTYVSEIDGLGEFETGKNAGWLYSVNGETPKTTASADYVLENGDVVRWYYTLDYTKDSSSSAWVGENQTVTGSEDLLNVSTEVKATTNSSGEAKATVTANQISSSVTEALKAADASKENVMTGITIDVEVGAKATSLETVIPKAAFANIVNSKIDVLTIDSAIGTISLDKETMKAVAGNATGDISITIEKNEELNGRPLLELTMKNGSTTVTKFAGRVTITVPYTLASGEKASGILVFYVNEEGKLLRVLSSEYDEKAKAVTFETDHFSSFVIDYKNVTFTDVKGHWAQTDIEYLANRNVIKGMTADTFQPNGNITRAQFVTLLMELAAAERTTNSSSAFGDVSPNAWYAEAVNWAVENNITQGYAAANGGKLFSPDANITRQDMAVMMSRYIDEVAKKSLILKDKKMNFADSAKISAYAAEAISELQQAGLINGKTGTDGNTSFDPMGRLTRAEAAKIIAGLMRTEE